MKKVLWTFLLVFVCAGSSALKQNTSPTPPIPKDRPKNIVLLIGDGMGLTQISAGLYAQGKLSLEKFPVIGFQKTYSADNLTTDSAASATAMACGKKTFNNAIGLDMDKKPLKSILEEAVEKGLATGLVSTSSIVHATPAAFISHQDSRNSYEDIAADFLKTDIDFFIGGGKQFFDRREKDDRNLLDELSMKGYFVDDYFRDDIEKVTPVKDKKFAFLTADNHPIPATHGRDYLPLASKMAVDFLEQKSDKGFFLMIEGSQIDWSCHANQGSSMLDEIQDFDKAILKILEFAKNNKETLVIVTADHETGGLALNEGPTPKKLDLKFTTNGHTSTMVPVFAFGPGAELFRGIYENTAIYDKMRRAFGFDNQ